MYFAQLIVTIGVHFNLNHLIVLSEKYCKSFLLKIQEFQNINNALS